jgi:hypothetical protein
VGATSGQGTQERMELSRDTVAQRELSPHETNWLNSSDDLEEAEWISSLNIDGTIALVV